MARQPGMGRGLAAILPESHEVGDPRYRDVPVELIKPNPGQPRKSFDDDALDRLADSVAESGVIQPLVVHPLSDGRYELIAGERRWRAAQQAGLATVPAMLRSEDETKRLQIALIENMAREDLNPVEEARACAALVEELEPQQGGGRAPGRSQPLDGLEPDPPARPARPGDRDARARRAQRGPRPGAARRPRQDERRALARQAVAEGWSVRETERRAKGEGASPRARPARAPPRRGGGDRQGRGCPRARARPRRPGPLRRRAA